MNEKTTKKINLSTLLLILCLIIIIVLGVFIYKILDNLQTLINNSSNELNTDNTNVSILENNNSLNELEADNTKISISENNISTNDLIGYEFDDFCSLVLINVNGTLYYSLDKHNEISNNSYSAEYTKLDENVKRIKSVRIGSDQSNSYFIIKNDGSVYELNVGYDSDLTNPRIIYNLEKSLNQYKIDDILSAEGVSGSESGLIIKATLIDGQTIDINTVK